MMSRPAAFNSVASAVIAMVGEALTRARRSARNVITSPWFYEGQALEAIREAGRCEAASRDRAFVSPLVVPIRSAAYYEGRNINKVELHQVARKSISRH